jgi:hypothetical protein
MNSDSDEIFLPPPKKISWFQIFPLAFDTFANWAIDMSEE